MIETKIVWKQNLFSWPFQGVVTHLFTHSFNLKNAPTSFKKGTPVLLAPLLFTCVCYT